MLDTFMGVLSFSELYRFDELNSAGGIKGISNERKMRAIGIASREISERPM